MAIYTGYARDYSDSTIFGLEIYVHPQGGPGLRPGGWDRIFVDKPFSVEWTTAAAFQVNLEPHHEYRLEFIYPDSDRSRIGQSWWSHPFRVPAGEGGMLYRILGMPAGNGMVRVLNRGPGRTDYYQYHYDETTGDLYERTP